MLRSATYRRLRGVACLGALGAVSAAPTGHAYPLDGAQRLAIRRLAGDQKAESEPQGKSRRLAPGALLASQEIRLHLTGAGSRWDLTEAPQDPALARALKGMLAERDPSYAIAVIDITDPEHIVWAGVREKLTYVPQSVGKLLVMAGFFEALTGAFPEPEERLRVLRETQVEVTDWAFPDSHRVPILDEETGLNRSAHLVRGQRFRLSEWIDHMVSASANGAGSTVWKEAMLLRKFGKAYPPSGKDEAAFFKETPRQELQELSLAVIAGPLRAAGLDLEALRQGTFYTRGGQARVPGAGSYASPRELVRLLLRIEQGRLVDAWSSLEMKRFLYFTRKRYRYGYAPELGDAALYFKSGSFYQCKKEPGFTCGKYRGNQQNLMNSVAIVESPAQPGPGQRRYLVALMSNVLRRNSAWDHSRIAAAIEEAVRTREAAEIREAGTALQVREAGTGE